MASLRPAVYVVLSIVMLVAITACRGSDGDVSQSVDTRPEPENFDPSAPELDTASLAADGSVGTFHASPYALTYAGEVTADMFIGIALPGGTITGGADEIKVYLCDGESIGLYFDGELSADGVAILTREDTTVNLELQGDSFVGTVVLPNGTTERFDATAASANAGMYWAETTIDDVDYRVNWIILEDGRQLGLVCCIEWWCPIPGCWPR